MALGTVTTSYVIDQNRKQLTAAVTDSTYLDLIFRTSEQVSIFSCSNFLTLKDIIL